MGADSFGIFMIHKGKMQIAINEALKAYAEGEVPVGAAIFQGETLISTAHNCKESLKQATAHAEITAINLACKMAGDWRLNGMTMYVTAEPCFMCAGAILQARIEKVVFGVCEPKFGGVVTHASLFDIPGLNSRVEYMGGVEEETIGNIMRRFFSELRKNKTD
ncbi:MAG: nucleoside deaminase [Deferribacteraceae bacterium]|jgi:tRNA(adenine34) deaminase|nr:nucleoside deaminase [Deferribacteraceae bacterium]